MSTRIDFHIIGLILNQTVPNSQSSHPKGGLFPTMRRGWRAKNLKVNVQIVCAGT